MSRQGNENNQVDLTSEQQHPSEDVFEESHSLTWKTDIFHHTVRKFSFGSFIFKLELNPNICPSILHLFLYEEKKSEVKFKTRAYVQDKNGKLVFEQSYKGSLERGPIICSVKQDELFADDDNFLREGVVVFGFEISPSVETVESQQVSTQSVTASPKTPVPSSMSLENLSLDFSKLFNNEESSDVVLSCGENKIKAHKYILSIRSSEFARMFRTNMTESQENVVKIKDLTPETLHRLIWYIYSGKMEDVTVGIASELYEAADKYDIESLKCLSVSFLAENLAEIFAWDILLLAEAHADEQLQKFVVDFIVENTDFLRTEQFSSYSREHPSLAVKVYEAYVFKQSQLSSGNSETCGRDKSPDPYIDLSDSNCSTDSDG